MRAPKSNGRIAGPKDLLEGDELNDDNVLLLKEYDCEGSDEGGEFVRGRPREVVDAFADAATLFVAEPSVGATEELRILEDGANTREL
jgi:hypothetical protein